MLWWRAIGRVGVCALVMAGCGGDPPAPSTVLVVQRASELTGSWYREITGAGGQRLSVFSDASYQLATGGVAFTGRPSATGRDGSIEFGRLRVADGLQWDVDSIVQFESSVVTGQGTRTVTRGPILFIEGHPFSNARATIRGRQLVLEGRNASIGAPANFRFEFARR